ncbi:hypothetical protein BH09MYX1_BH09MYX1_07150 [soil metagenome]
MALASIGLTAASCGGAPEQPLAPAPENTSGEGTVQATAGPNGNTKFEVQVKRLSAPARVASDATVYVVWVQAPTGEVQNVGALLLDSDYVGKLETTTPHKAFTLTVTPEPSAGMAAPTHKAVFTSNVKRSE